MNVWRLLLGLSLLLAAVAPTVAYEERREPARNVVLFGWDGAQRNHVWECLARGELPTLARLAREGALVEIDIEGTTDTKAGWAQILTGYHPEVTGVHSNGKFRPIPVGLTVFERLEAHFGTERFASLAVIGKTGNVGCAAPKRVKLGQRTKKGKKRKRRPKGEVVEIDGARYVDVPGEPYFLTKGAMDLFENGLKLDETVGTRALQEIERVKDRPFFLFVHFAEVDSSGHRHGENSKEYTDALISNDLWTGRIIERLEELGLSEKTRVYVTADHGFDEGLRGHKNAPYVFLATNDPRVSRRGLRQDVAPTMLEAFGLDLKELDPPLDGVPLTRPVTRTGVKLGPRPGLAARKRGPVEIVVEAEAYARKTPDEKGFAVVRRTRLGSGGAVLSRLTAAGGRCFYVIQIPKRSVYHAWIRYATSRDVSMPVLLDAAPQGRSERTVDLPATTGPEGRVTWRWAPMFKSRLDPGTVTIALGSAPTQVDCIVLKSRKGPPAHEVLPWTEPPSFGPETLAKLAKAEVPVRPAWLDAAQGYALPSWFEGSRVCAHTRLSSRWREDPVFTTAGEKLASLGFKTFSRHIKSGSEGAWWPSRVGAVEEWARERNVAKQIIDEAHRAGTRILVYHRHTEDRGAAEAHPDWVCRGDPLSGSKPIDGKRGPQLCLNTPYADHVLTRLLELVDMGADGFYFDYVHMPKDGCFCGACGQRFNLETGLAPPPVANPRDPVYRRYVDFKNETIERAFLRWRQAIHGRNPEAVLLIGSNTYPSMLERHTTHRLYRIADSVKTEWSKGPLRLIGISDTTLSFGWDLARDAADGRPAHVWVHGLLGSASAVYATAGIVAHGCIANLDHPEGEIPNPGKFAKAVALGNRVSPHLAGTRPVRFALVHCSERARDARWPSPVRVGAEVVRPTHGAYRTFVGMRLPTAMITDSQLEEGVPAETRILFLADGETITPPMRKSVESFILRGGLLVTQRPEWLWHAGLEEFEKAQEGLREVVHDAGIRAPVRVFGGSDAMHAMTYATPDRKRLVVALANEFDWVMTGRHSSRELRERQHDLEPVPRPCKDVTVKLPGRPKRVFDAVTGKDLPTSRTPGGFIATVAEFEALAVVVAEY
ncbi:MAG: alkaline phosphatase family protein [Planctomycetota bacterium]